jgi:hypothetical protein
MRKPVEQQTEADKARIAKAEAKRERRRQRNITNNQGFSIYEKE